MASDEKRGQKSGSGRNLKTRVRTAKGRRLSSTRWLQRQLNDPYVQAAQRDGYRSRAAYKLADLDDRFKILRRGAQVVDLGAAPGGWSQIAAARVGRGGRVVAVDLTAIDAISGVAFLQLDFNDATAPDTVKAALTGPVDVVLSDMAAPATGHRATDHLRIVLLCELALEFAEEVLAPNGSFVAKVLAGGAEADLLARLKRGFRQVRHAKPAASRKDSSESYVVATGFRGAAPAPDADTD
jgi:23S rRNA (uridine2552-2'-O)-methyltransferase